MSRALRFRAPAGLWAVTLFALPSIGTLLAILIGLPTTLPLGMIILTLVVAAPINGLLGGCSLGSDPSARSSAGAAG